jgi:spore maturation protein CgeB
MQRPVVATPEATAGLPAVPGANVLVGKDRADLLARIRELLLDPARAQALAAAGRKAVIESCDLGVSARAFASVCEREVKDGLSRGIR